MPASNKELYFSINGGIEEGHETGSAKGSGRDIHGKEVYGRTEDSDTPAEC